MTMKQHPRKQGGLPARLYALWSLRKWAAGFSGRFPSAREFAGNSRYWNEKVATDHCLLEGPTATHGAQRECAQLLIDACAHLIRAKPRGRPDMRVTCCVSIPDLWSSEICVYLDEAYFAGHAVPSSHERGKVSLIGNRSLAQEWGLLLPPGVFERGIHVDYPETATHEGLTCDRWYYGEVAIDGSSAGLARPG